MDLKRKKTYSTHPIGWFLIILVLISASFIQAHLLMSWDIGWHWLDTIRLLKGGTYTQDFFDVNPPMLLYLLIPPTLIQQWTGLEFPIIFRIYIFLISILSLIICSYLVKKLFHTEERFKSSTIILTLSVIFFLLPIYELGQRDPLMVTLIMPYLFTVLVRQQKIHLSSTLSLLIGIFAGFGFSLNIQFFALFILFEIFLFLKGNLLLRTETKAILCIFLLYFLSVFIFFPDYVTQVLPLVFYLYADTFNSPWARVLGSAITSTWISAAIFFGIEYFQTRYRHFSLLFFTSATIAFIIFLLTRKLWYYHMFPTIAFSSFLLVFFLSENIKTWHRLSSKFKAIMLIILLAWFPALTMGQIIWISWQTKSNPNSAINQILTYVSQKAAGKTIAVFSTTVTPAGILIPYAHVNLGSRFAGYWMLPGIIMREKQKLSSKDELKLLKAKAFLNKAVVEDFNHYKPDLVLVDISKQKFYFPPGKFDYINYFSQDPLFAKIWRFYHYQTTIANFAIYSRGFAF